MLPAQTASAQGNFPFGEAVCKARAYIYDQVNNPPNNTWGAYQCYGDPGFMLNPTVHAVRTPENNYVAPSEILRELRNQQSRAARLSDPVWLTGLKQAVCALEAQLPAAWQNGELLYTFGETYAELGDFPQAISRYRAALLASSPNERVPIRAIEQLANLEGRYAQALMTTTHDSRPDLAQDAVWNPEALLTQAEARLVNLNHLAATPERQAMLGSCYKRKAMFASAEARRTALQQAAASYEAADRLAKANGRTDFYHTLNQVTCWFLGETTVDKATRQTMLALLDQGQNPAAKPSSAEPDFWKRVAPADLALTRALVQGTIGTNPAAIQQLYAVAFDVGATARQRATVSAHIEFVSTMLEGKDDKAAAALRQLYKTLME